MLHTKLPPCLRPMLKPKQYAKFATEVNALMAWDCYTTEFVIFVLILILAPPLIASVIVSKQFPLRLI